MMLRKSHLFISLILCIFVVDDSFADSASHIAAAEKYIEASILDKDIKEYQSKLYKTLESQFDKVDIPEEKQDQLAIYKKQIKEKIEKTFAWNQLRKTYVNILVSIYTEEELLELSRFYESEIGKISLKKDKLLQGKTTIHIQEKFVEVSQLFNEAMMELTVKFKTDKNNTPAVQSYPDPKEGMAYGKLRNIKFPDNPTKKNIRTYVEQIINASRHQRSYSSSDPQVEMLKKVGPENIDILIDPLYRHSFYLNYAVKALVNDSHKDMIIGMLERNTELVDVIIDHGWSQTARETLLKMIRRRPSRLNHRWAEAVAQLNDPATYEDLKYLLIHGHARSWTYRAIQHLPDIQLEDAVHKAWSMAKTQDFYQKISMAQVAMTWGHIDALENIINNLGSSYSDTEELRSQLQHILDFYGTDQEIRDWYRQHRGSLIFDQSTRMYKIAH